ncbi:MAG: hypothetical protein ABFD54_08570 [Armatimonadota bacterium]
MQRDLRGVKNAPVSFESRKKQWFYFYRDHDSDARYWLLLAIAIPNFLHARETTLRKTCLANLQEISSKEQMAGESRLATGATVCWSHIVPDYIKLQPTCPGNGTYSLGVIG